MNPETGKKVYTTPADPQVISAAVDAANDPSAPYFGDGGSEYTSLP